MSELPERWCETTVGNVSHDISYGFTTSASSMPNGPKFLRITDIQNGIVDWKTVPFCEVRPNDASRFILKAGDIVFARTGATTGKSYLIRSTPEAVFASYLIRLRPSECILPELMAYFFQSPAYWKQITENISGSAQPNCNATKLSSLAIPIPPLNEQIRIVAKLEKLLSRVDAAQVRLATIPRILRRFRQSVLAAACSGQLTADWREHNPNVESAESYLPKSNPDAVLLENSEIPASWVCCKLENLSELITKGASPKWQGISYSTKGVLFVTSENVGSGRMLLDTKKYVEEKFNELQKRSILKSGDLLTNIVGASIGRSAIYELQELANINQAVAVIRLRQFVDRRYVLNVLNSPGLVDHMHSEKVDVARANLSLKDVANFPIPLPPLAEQQEIVRRVEALFKTADALEARYRSAKAHVDKLTQSILAKAFRGELVPQDPNDKPAALVLELIKKKHGQNDVVGKAVRPKRRRAAG